MMPAISVAIHSKRMLLPEGVREATLLIDNGLITRAAPGPPGPAIADNVDCIDVGDRIVMPGLIDPHVHINEPGRTDWEGFDTATRAAIAGGFTLLVDMPLNSSPVTTTSAAFDQKLAAAAGQLHCDCGYWGGVVPGNEADIEGLIAHGVLGFKAFLTHSGIDEFPNVTETQLRKVMPILAAHGLPLLVHCELDSPADSPADPDPRSYPQYLASRPALWEDKAIALMIRLCAETRCPVHIVHLSSAASIPQIRAAKEKGLPLTVETAPHYLYFAAETIADGNPLFKCAPPIRDRANNLHLWEALREGVIDLIATDHSPAPPDLKQLATGNLPAAWGGIASLQLSLSAVWSAAREQGFGPEDIARWLSANPARLTHQSACRGKLAPGYRADLAIWDPDASFRVDPQALHHKHKGTPYAGETLIGTIDQTWLKGEKVFDKGAFGQRRGNNIFKK
jgi:allantoinase